MNSQLLFQEVNRPIGEMERLFDRIELKTTEKLVAASKQSSSKAAPKKPQENSTESPAQITFKDFQKLELKVGHVLEAEAVPKSKKLLKIQVDIGEENPRQIVSGISPSYQPQDLVGTKVVVVANLAPAKLMGIESQGMILSGENGDLLSLLRIDRDLPPGAQVR
tara:strand:+ start:249 stop:743 length:495 start_codon:yes stop_codon:yes gene_type:complete